MQKKGFTLAETLITMVIVGVVAAITIPLMVVNFQKEETVTRLKKAYSSICQTTNKAQADYGSIPTWTINDTSAESALDFVNTYIAPYMRITKAPTTYAQGGWDNVYYGLNKTRYTYPSNAVRFYLDDGTSITTKFAEANRLTVEIDINGDRKPNKYGRDKFEMNYCVQRSTLCGLLGLIPDQFHLTREDLLSTSNTYRCNKARTGHECLAVIIKDGWQIKDDYPW